MYNNYSKVVVKKKKKQKNKRNHKALRKLKTATGALISFKITAYSSMPVVDMKRKKSCRERFLYYYLEINIPS